MKTLIILFTTFLATTSLKITSTSFSGNEMIPSKYTCDGDNISPNLHLKTLPGGTKTLAVIMYDPDASMKGGFTHWLVWNIDPVLDIPENFKGGEQGMNGAKKEGYIGPCPPGGTHHYHFNVYALDTKLTLDKNTTKEMLEMAMKGHILEKGKITGLYKKKVILSGTK